jgi:hypothetical protein
VPLPAASLATSQDSVVADAAKTSRSSRRAGRNRHTGSATSSLPAMSQAVAVGPLPSTVAFAGAS